MKAIAIIIALTAGFSSLGQKISNIRMRSISKPIVRAEINGKKAFFLIDTGSSVSLINSSELKHFDLRAANLNDRRKAVGFNGDKEWMKKVVNAELILGEHFTYRDFYSMDLDVIVSSIQKETNMRISGIIGTDFLKRHRSIIDYNKRYLTLADRKSYKTLVSLSNE